MDALDAEVMAACGAVDRVRRGVVAEAGGWIEFSGKFDPLPADGRGSGDDENVVRGAVGDAEDIGVKILARKSKFENLFKSAGKHKFEFVRSLNRMFLTLTLTLTLTLFFFLKSSFYCGKTQVRPLRGGRTQAGKQKHKRKTRGLNRGVKHRV